MRAFTIYARGGDRGVLMHTDNADLAHGALRRGHRVTRHLFGQDIDLDADDYDAEVEQEALEWELSSSERNRAAELNGQFGIT